MIVVVTRKQFFTALADAGVMNQTYQTIPMDVNDPVWIEFNSAKKIEKYDALYTAIQTSLNYSPAQMASLFEDAVQVPT